MILDAKGEIAVAYAPTTNGAIQYPTTYYDELVLADIGAGETVGFYIQVSTAVTSAGSATVTFSLIGNATDPTFASGNQVLWVSQAIAKATLVLGYQIQVKVPPGFVARYFTLGVTIGTADLTAGVFNAWLLNDNFQTAKNTYPAGYTVQ